MFQAPNIFEQSDNKALFSVDLIAGVDSQLVIFEMMQTDIERD